MSVITISREFGSEGEMVAERAAQALGYHFVDKEFIGKVLDEYGLVEFNREYDTQVGFWDKYSIRRDVMVNMLNQVVFALARHGNVVILGRSGFAILAGFTDVLHVRLQAPQAVRVGRVMAHKQLSQAQAEDFVKENDKIRQSFVEEFYRTPWGATHSFDLVINTGKISPNLAARWIIDAAQVIMTSPAMDQPTTASIEVDPVLTRVINDRLACEQEH